jgi:ribonuclease-3
MYLEAGLTMCQEVVVTLLEETYPKIDLNTLSKDYKTALQELTQATHGVTPSYQQLNTKGPDHKKEFEIGIILNNNQIASAWGKTKKEAQQKAAKIALEKLRNEDNRRIHSDDNCA